MQRLQAGVNQAIKRQNSDKASQILQHIKNGGVWSVERAVTGIYFVCVTSYLSVPLTEWNAYLLYTNNKTLIEKYSLDEAVYS